jgi:hypothetical protein
MSGRDIPRGIPESDSLIRCSILPRRYTVVTTVWSPGLAAPDLRAEPGRPRAVVVATREAVDPRAR